MDYTEGEYISGVYTSDNDEWWVQFDYDGEYHFMRCDWGGHPKGCTQKQFNAIMRKFDEGKFNFPGDDVQAAFEALAEKEGWE